MLINKVGCNNINNKVCIELGFGKLEFRVLG